MKVFLAKAYILNDLQKVIILKMIPSVIQGPKPGKYSLKLISWFITPNGRWLFYVMKVVHLNSRIRSLLSDLSFWTLSRISWRIYLVQYFLMIISPLPPSPCPYYCEVGFLPLNSLLLFLSSEQRPWDQESYTVSLNSLLSIFILLSRELNTASLYV